MLNMFQAVSPPIIRGSNTVNTASGICQDCLLLPLAWMRWNSPMLAVAVSNLDIYPMLFLQFLSSWWWAEKPPETCTALTVLKSTVQRCILFVILNKYIKPARSHERKKSRILFLTNIKWTKHFYMSVYVSATLKHKIFFISVS